MLRKKCNWCILILLGFLNSIMFFQFKYYINQAFALRLFTLTCTPRQKILSYVNSIFFGCVVSHFLIIPFDLNPLHNHCFLSLLFEYITGTPLGWSLNWPKFNQAQQTSPFGSSDWVEREVIILLQTEFVSEPFFQGKSSNYPSKFERSAQVGLIYGEACCLSLDRWSWYDDGAFSPAHICRSPSSPRLKFRAKFCIFIMVIYFYEGVKFFLGFGFTKSELVFVLKFLREENCNAGSGFSSQTTDPY